MSSIAISRGEVASLAEAWIETPTPFALATGDPVASLAEAWIETSAVMYGTMSTAVASLAEAWIETPARPKSKLPTGRLPRGGVDRN